MVMNWSRLISLRWSDEHRRQRNNETKKFTHSFLLEKNFGLITKVRGYTKGLMGGGAVKYADKTWARAELWPKADKLYELDGKTPNKGKSYSKTSNARFNFHGNQNYYSSTVGPLKMTIHLEGSVQKRFLLTFLAQKFKCIYKLWEWTKLFKVWKSI